MKNYLKAKPFIYVKSKIFFEFQARRMEELRNVQKLLYRNQDKNYGTITTVLMHLIRHVSHSPIAMAPYLRDALCDLRFNESMATFGMFFLQDLDLDNCVMPGIEEEDSQQCRRDMTGKAHTKKSRPTRNMNTEPDSQFPIGNAPSWAEIIDVLYHEPMKLLRTWVWDEDWDTDKVAGDLFIKFTRQF